MPQPSRPHIAETAGGKNIGSWKMPFSWIRWRFGRRKCHAIVNVAQAESSLNSSNKPFRIDPDYWIIDPPHSIRLAEKRLHLRRSLRNQNILSERRNFSVVPEFRPTVESLRRRREYFHLDARINGDMATGIVGMKSQCFTEDGTIG